MGNKTEDVLLEAKNEKDENIKPQNNAKILGIVFSKSLTWKEYLEVGKDAIVPKLKKKLGALKFTCRKASFNAKLKLAHGCIMSHIIYRIQVWGLHCRPSVIKKVQSVQNNTMKWITGRYSDCTKELLTVTKWMSVFQLAIYHSLLLYWKINFRNKPERMVRRLQISENSFARMLLAERVWSRVTERYYRMVESSCGGISKISIIKRILSEWVKENVPIAED